MIKAMIVDDAKLMRNIIKNALNPKKYKVVCEARNGKEAIMNYKIYKPDIVTMDITMDEKNGLEAAEEILKYDNTARIIMVTSLAQMEIIKKCIHIGAKNFIVKPFSKEKIQKVMEDALES